MRLGGEDSVLGHASRIIALTDDECDALMAAAVASADPDLWLFVAVGLNTAIWHSEIIAARRDHLDLANRRRISGHEMLAMVLRETDVHGRHIDDAIRAIGRTLPKRAANGTENPITPKLHQGAGSGPAEKPVNKPELKAV